jgi:hypothetical protein
MSTTGCCTDQSGAYLGDGVNQGVYLEDPKVVFFQRKYKDDGSLNTLDLTQANFKTYFLGLIQTTTAEESRIYPSGKLDFVEIPDRTEYGSYQKTDGHTVIMNSTGGIQSVKIGWDGNRATFERLRQLSKMDCNEWTIYFFDSNKLTVGYKDSQEATTMRGYPISKESWDRMMKIGVATDPSRVSVKFEIDRDATFDNAYGIPHCESNLSFEDVKPLNPAYASFISETSDTVIVIGLRHAVGKAENGSNKHFTGAATDGVFTIKPDGAAAITATAVENATTERYTLTLASAMPAATPYKLSINEVTGWGIDGFVQVSDV